MELLSLSRRTAVVIGAGALEGRGMGRAICQALGETRCGDRCRGH